MDSQTMYSLFKGIPNFIPVSEAAIKQPTFHCEGVQPMKTRVSMPSLDDMDYKMIAVSLPTHSPILLSPPLSVGGHLSLDLGRFAPRPPSTTSTRLHSRITGGHCTATNVFRCW